MSEPIFVSARRVPPMDLEADLQRVRRFAKLLDSEFQIFGYRVGLDPIIGLIPVLGDTVGALLGIYPIIIARKHNLGIAIQIRMAMNILIEWLGGAIPLVGEVFDAVYKANLKNADLLEAAVEKRRSI